MRQEIAVVIVVVLHDALTLAGAARRAGRVGAIADGGRARGVAVAVVVVAVVVVVVGKDTVQQRDDLVYGDVEFG
ncbi:hypothetical protein B0H19DRAFT_1178673 [Mycena capillaripes]|nr:hypothetical protein B0H19DRAFT_1178673 [Mycena capillaripes]